MPEGLRARAEELDEKDIAGTLTPDEEDETWDLMWPGYVVEGAGHFIWWERPGAVLSALRRLADGASPR